MADAQHTDPPSTLLPALTQAPAGIVRQVAPTGEIVAAQQAYHDLCQALLSPTQDYQRIGRKDFPKKSAWRKLAVAFNVSVELIERSYERDERGRIIRAEVIARATAPNGRTMDGLGACDLYEKCCPGTDGLPGDCTNRSQYHTHCRLNCNGKPHFSNPSHDLPSTAHTRATNRACADLFGMGEVSAEEITNASVIEDQAPLVDPYVPLGWADQADHDGHRKTTDERVKGLSPEAKAELKSWVDSPDNVPGGYRSAWARSVAESYRVEVMRLAGLAPKADTETGEVATPADSAPAAQEQAEPAESGTGTPDTTSGVPAAPEQAQDKDPEEVLFDKITAEVAAMPLGDVRKALPELLDPATAMPFSPNGKPDEVRSRLALALFQQQAWAAESGA